MIRRTLVLSVMVGIWSLSSCQTTLSFCDNMIEITCEKALECTEGATPKYKNTADCVRQQKLKTDCEQFGCKSGFSFDGFQGDRCVNDYKAMTCDDLKVVSLPASCGALCKLKSSN